MGWKDKNEDFSRVKLFKIGVYNTVLHTRASCFEQKKGQEKLCDLFDFQNK